MHKLKLFKPLMKLENNEIIIFDEFRNKYSETNIKAGGVHPFVIFYNENEHTYYYLKCRSAYYNNESKKLRYKLKGEILINKANCGLLKCGSYIDCSQIFKIDADLMESLVNTDCDLYKQTSILPKEDIDLVLNTINECCNEEPPYLSILEIYKVGVEIKADSLYLCDEKYNDYKTDYEYWDRKRGNLKPIDWNYYVSDIQSNYDRYIIGIEFKKMFQDKYFSKHKQTSKTKLKSNVEIKRKSNKDSSKSKMKQ